MQRALYLIGYAAEFEGYHLDSQTAGQMRQWLFDLAPLVASDVAGSIATLDVCLGMGSAAALLFPAVDECGPDRISYTKMLAAQLSILLHRRQLLQRGEPLLRALTLGQIWRAADAAPHAYH
ncbi:hypothetical protein SAMN02983003_3858 [Devosia enhydra]|uniref:Uncharacterized protein n=1 Tax=Devosia enhydra TaxID=665118 RepID=A0A1K2I2W6_9HYPH|nr:hypothetical protein SAMN02983003_3858 [Devosia enhydra]